MENEDNIPMLISVKPLNTDFSNLQKIALTSQQFTLGRSIGKSAVIPYIAISRLHCIFKKLENNDWCIEDCSRLGIFINNKKLEKGSQVVVNDGDIIILEPSKEFVYKFSHPKNDMCETPKKRIKLETNTDSFCIMNNVKMKFEESQNCEIKHIEDKIQNAKQLQETTLTLKKELQEDMDRHIQRLECDFAEQIAKLGGEKDEVERQKSFLIEERDEQLAQVKKKMEGKIAELMEQIQKHDENESELMKENNLLKDKLNKERDDFLAELSRESTSKKDMLEKLEAKIREQEEVRLREKRELEETLKKETNKLRLAQEKELKEITEQKRLRELELEQELTNIKQKLQEKVEQTEEQRQNTELQLIMKMEQLQKVSDEDKNRVEQLQKERMEIQNQLLEAQQNAEKASAELRLKETELAKLAIARKQAQTDQSNEVMTLQEQLEKMNKAFESLKSEKDNLVSTYVEGGDAGPSTSNENALQVMREVMDSDLLCIVCSEMFVEATVLNCAHTFCKYCITMWKKKKNDCPICRASITSENRSLVIDNFVERMVTESISEDMKVKRQTMIKSRAGLVSQMARQAAGTSANRGRRRRSYRSSYESELFEDDEFVEEEEGNEIEREREDYYEHERLEPSGYNYSNSGSDNGSDTYESSRAAAGAGAARHAAARAPGGGAGAGRGPGARGSWLSTRGEWGGASGGWTYARGFWAGARIYWGDDGLPAIDAASVALAADNNLLPGGESSTGGERRQRRTVPGIPGSFYGGYGRCYSCGLRGHWAPGCPY